MARVLSGFLADTSALARLRGPSVAERLEPLIGAGRVATCTVVDLELRRSARSPREHRELEVEMAAIYGHVDVGQRALDRAAEVQGALARRGHHRGVPVADLVIAAAAEQAALAVLHYDADFDRIATVTRQPVEWVVPRGSID